MTKGLGLELDLFTLELGFIFSLPGSYVVYHIWRKMIWPSQDHGEDSKMYV